MHSAAPDCIYSLIPLVLTCRLCARQSSHLRNDSWNLCVSIHHTHRLSMPSDLCSGMRSFQLMTLISSFRQCRQRQPGTSSSSLLKPLLCFSRGSPAFTYLRRGSMSLAAHSSGQLHEVSTPACSTLPRCRDSRGCRRCCLCPLRSEAIQRRQAPGQLCGSHERNEP